jgi:predicted N-acetyltransferase YhbS
MITDTIEIRPFRPADTDAVAAMVRQVFDEHVAPSFAPEGIAEMHQYVAAQAIAGRAKTHRTFVAWQGRQVVGVIEVRQTDHVSMLFVCTSHMGLGIATALMARAIDACRAACCPKLTVNSSLNAQSFYGRLGFVAADEPQKAHGFAFIPMEKDL